MAAYVFLCTCRAGCPDNVVLCSSVDVLKGWLDSFSSWLPQCWGLPVNQLGGFLSFAPCLEHVCAGGGGGGSVANEGLVLYIGGDYSLRL